MRLTIKLFASIRERARTSELEREFPEGTTVTDVWRWLIKEFPALATHGDAPSFAVNLEYVEPTHCPRDRDEVAFIPPVSGGNDAGQPAAVEITRDRIAVERLEKAVATAEAGALVTFVGIVRNENVGRRVLRLQYEAYEPMALREMQKLSAEAQSRFRIIRIALAHRVGMLEIGDASVAIAVSAAHRAEAFDACRFLIDRIKEIVPIWKKEFFEGGEVWVGCQTSHPPPLA
jgi:molybdopterin synthase catalytic subunit